MSEELQLIPIEEQISLELVKQNVTETIIANLREKYLPLKITGIDDKETYLQVKEARKECKALRVLAKKICENGREDAVAIQKAWVGKQKEVTDQISEVEDYLEKQEKQFEADVAKDKEDRKRRHEEQLIMRQQILSAMGVLYSDGAYTLGEVSFELSVIKETEPDIWEESILPKFIDEYGKVEAERIEQDRIKLEREAELKRQQDELEQKQLELVQREHALKLAQEEQVRTQKEEDDRKIAETEALIKLVMTNRYNELQSFGMASEFPSMDYVYGDVRVSFGWMQEAAPEKWAIMVTDIKSKIELVKAEEERKRLAEIEEQKKVQRVMALGKARLEELKRYDAETESTADVIGKLDDKEWEIIRAGWQDTYDKKQKDKWEKEQKEKRELDELRKQQELALSGDKVKWAEIIKQLDEVTLYTMISVQYKKKLGIMREKLEEIKSL